MLKARKLLWRCWVRPCCALNNSTWWWIIVVSCGGVYLLLLLVSISLPEADVCNCYSLRRMEWIINKGAAYLIYDLRCASSKHNKIIFSYLSGTFYYFNSIVNPFLYSVMSKRFRRGLSDVRQLFQNCSSNVQTRNNNTNQSCSISSNHISGNKIKQRGNHGPRYLNIICKTDT